MMNMISPPYGCYVKTGLLVLAGDLPYGLALDSTYKCCFKTGLLVLAGDLPYVLALVLIEACSVSMLLQGRAVGACRGLALCVGSGQADQERGGGHQGNSLSGRPCHGHAG